MEQLEKQIGEAAGKIWKTLEQRGPMTRSRLAEAAELSAPSLNQGIGWLAREGKLASEKKSRADIIMLKE